MALSILIVTPNHGFGELIKQTLESEEVYDVMLVDKGSDARLFASQNPVDLLILDSDITDVPCPELFTATRSSNPSLRLILIPPNNDPVASLVWELRPQGVLTKPFYLPELVAIVEDALAIEPSPHLPPPPAPSSSEEAPEIKPETNFPDEDIPYPWLNEEETEDPFFTEPTHYAEEPLTSLPPELFSASLESIPEQSHTPDFFPQPAMEFPEVDYEDAFPPVPELAPQPIHPPAHTSSNADFAWLSDPEAAAQTLSSHMVTSEAQAALIIRDDRLWAYAGKLSQHAVRELSDNVRYYWRRYGGADLARFTKLETTTEEYLLFTTPLKTNQAIDLALTLVFDTEISFRSIRMQVNGIAQSLLGKKSSPQPISPQKPAPSHTTDLDLIPSDWKPNYPHPAVPRSATPPRPAVPPPPIPAVDYNTPEIPAQPFSTAPTQPIHAENDLINTHTRPFTIESVSPAMYHLVYASLLLPRFPHHALKGDLAAHLSEWIPNICIAFGWRLTNMLIRPGYLLWLTNVPPSTSPSVITKTIRKSTSQRIFAEFPRIKEENPSGDFWAPGYLILSSDSLPPQDLIQQFIRQTRTRQGLRN